MAVSLSIKDVPDEVANALRERAARNHRSLQGELMHILETAVRGKPFDARAFQERLEAIGLNMLSESTALVRESRDSR